MSSRLYIAAAGAGKTHKIIEEVINTNEKVLITTYTINNTNQIRDRIKKKLGYIPSNIIICTWMSFLLNEWIYPYQGIKLECKIKGIILDNKDNNRFLSRNDIKYYVKNGKLHNEKISDFACLLNELNGEEVINRIKKIYSKIYVDEVQDLVGYDHEVLKKLIDSNVDVVMLGDPRQCAFATHNTRKHIKYKNGKIKEFINNNCKGNIIVDETTLNNTHRCNDQITQLANLLYPEMKAVESKRKCDKDDEGVFQIDEKDVSLYLQKYNAVQLRFSAKVKVADKYPVYNFGESKGLEFESVLIYTTNDFDEWINDVNYKLKEQTRAKFYIAITRAKHRVVIVNKGKIKNDNIKFFPFDKI
ncbi:UvrD-helicase domain-containing protein [Mycoplasma bradburyae]|uniref:UvrD-helicase domain-containing protein n=1 Tax=Mycoplasma bradburyae TaxID=2963128 RepID=A0ABT5GBN0_9MOLU|nr:UvrD-helicase domain-containing protein [Mycoplasma bradburyae]MDC4182243.1 UvrD-helicase domain-containing protein [Mycoplasma bradburyae]UTS70066.1 UvrD-helicase domain-containing protein [Mycoplasma bradburyae]